MKSYLAKAFSLLLVGAVSVGGCAPESASEGGVHRVGALPPPPDVGSIERFDSCEARPRRALSAREQCQIEKLVARCTAADDCLVSCISSPHGSQVGGGCGHVCFSGPHRSEPKPPGWNECNALPQLP